MKGLIKKSLTSSLALTAIFVLIAPDIASAFSWPTPSNAAKEGADGVTAKYGIDSDSIIESSRTFNAGAFKQQPPQVYVSFDPQNPAPGERVTATAEPLYFGNSNKEQMYFTWYLRHADERESDDIESFKVRAAKIIATDNFEYRGEDYASDTDTDGYKAVFGGEDQRGKNNHCYFHDVRKGADYEFGECEHLFPNASEERKSGDGSFGAQEEEFWGTDPNDPDTADLGRPDEASIVGLGQSSFTWTYQQGDQVGVAIEGVSFQPTPYKDSSYKVMWALSKNTCDLNDDPFEDAGEEEVPEPPTVEPAEWPENLLSTGGTFTRTVKRKIKKFRMAPSSSYKIGKVYMRVKTEEIKLNGATSTVGGSATAEATGGANPSSSTSINLETTTEGGAEPPEESTACYEKDEIPADYRTGEQAIVDKSCCPDGNSTCSIVTFNTTDEVLDESGLDPKDGSMFKMEIEELNKCLLDNFIDPTEGGKFEKLDIQLSYSPQNPMNDTTSEGNGADELVIQSSISNSKDKTYLNYDWKVFKGESIEGEWKEMLKESLPEVSTMSGRGLDSLKFRLNFKEPSTYLKIKLSVSEDAYGGTRKGYSDIVIPLNSSANKISVMGANVDKNTLNLSLGDPICTNNGQDDAICTIAKNQLVGLKASEGLTNVVWTMDGKRITEYESGQENIAYFATLKNKGENITISMTGTDEKKQKVNLTKVFQVGDPGLSIVSKNESQCRPKLLGYYADLDDKEWPDYSQDEFEAIKGKSMELAPQDGQSANWIVDGEFLGNFTTLKLTADKAAGERYTITAQRSYSPDNGVKKALSQYWDVQLDQFYEKDISDTIDVTVVETIETAQASQKFMASLISGLPSYTLFLLRITLTTALILFIFRVITHLVFHSQRDYEI